jgi:hypothetical protein
MRCSPVQGRLSPDLHSGRPEDPDTVSHRGFVHWNGSTYKVKPELNAALLEKDGVLMVDLTEICFEVLEM